MIYKSVQSDGLVRQEEEGEGESGVPRGSLGTVRRY